MILRSDVPGDVAELANRRQALASMADIPDLWKYADAWSDLGGEFASCGYKANAEKCFQKAAHYAAQAGPRKQILQPYRILYCGECQTWTQHALNVTQDFYSCGCGAGNQIDNGIASAVAILTDAAETEAG